MISDILSKAVCEIERCRKDTPNVYDENKGMIDATIGAMNALRSFFDAPPLLEDAELKEMFWEKISELPKAHTEADDLNRREG